MFSLTRCLPHQYHFTGTAVPWLKAQAYCREHHTDLATVFDIEDMNRLVNSDQDSTGGVKGKAWIGLHNNLTSFRRMNDSLALPGVGRLGWDAGILADDRLAIGNKAAFGVLLGGLCFGVFGLLLFMVAVCRRSIDAQHLTVFKVSLIVTGLFQSLATPAMGVLMMSSFCSVEKCKRILASWYASIRCGMLLHLLVALEFIVIWKWSGRGPKVLPLYGSLPVVIILNVICTLFCNVSEFAVALGVMGAALTLLIFAQASCSVKPLEKLPIKVVCTAFFTFGLTYCPTFIVECMILNSEPISLQLYGLFLCLTNIRLVMDGYLCWLTCRETPEEPSQQVETTQAGPDVVIQS
ncbi:hypothetical protein L3Q82_016737 [Scortum barcoo]|uniref:Uncharacterized protein n=1 Tax=Scortum barcoo TaxID=214431 RepID=A0ACB8X8B3_9TELE|nr:hypothetical protein L3Q82_016737 [Scortum barcoo]